ncbi:MAG: MvaI/BcnI family restriction endonuclease [Acidobacteria bacterium]|nr:MvaI/BcnI family restriction endonuclease [Acidobacteriota bacterium]
MLLEYNWEFNLTGFCDSLQRGIVCIDFDARTQQGRGTALRNHGTKFRVRVDHLSLLYKNSRKIT